MAQSLVNTIDQSKSIEGQIVQVLRGGMFRSKVWILVESSIDQRIYKRLCSGHVILLPAVGPGGQRPNCLFVEQIVRHILGMGITKQILGIRDTDYTRFWHEHSYALPQNIVHTHCRDLEMLLLSAHSCQRALVAWDSGFPNRINECEDYIRFMGYIRVWHDNYKYMDTSLDLKKFRWGCILDNDHVTISSDWKQHVVDRYNMLCGTKLTVSDVEDYARQKGLDKQSRYDICRGHDYLPCLASRMVKTDIYSEKTIRARMSDNYSRDEFWKSKTGARIKAIAAPWHIKVDRK